MSLATTLPPTPADANALGKQATGTHWDRLLGWQGFRAELGVAGSPRSPRAWAPVSLHRLRAQGLQHVAGAGTSPFNEAGLHRGLPQDQSMPRDALRSNLHL